MRESDFGRSAALAAGLSAFILSSDSALAAPTPWGAKTFFDSLEAGQIQSVNFTADGTKLFALDDNGNLHETSILSQQVTEIISILRKKGIEYMVEAKGFQPPKTADIISGLGQVLPFLVLGFLSSRQDGFDQTGGAGKSRSKIEMEPKTGVTFNEVAGCDGAKLELNEVVDFLKDPTKYSAVGAEIPKGVIMEGPPGTGKTLLARAVAGEAGVPFVSATGSEFVEMYVGVGASRVRDLFEQAKKNAPCIIFIDEIDAIGRQRSSGDAGGGGNEEREMTLNQILTEMDGFQGNTGVLVIAATNRADVLDNALTRPGRFDRRVPVDLPDVSGRRQILGVHSRNKPLDADVDLQVVAKRTIGFSGASLENLMNEAAIVAARNGKTSIGYEEVDYAIDRITVGMQKTTGTSFPNRQRLVAYHEAGHAILGLVMREYDTVTKVTIIPRTSGAGGFTLFTPSEESLESGMYSKKYLVSQLVVALGGRVAEEIIFGKDEITTGASNDLQQVRSIARRMVAQWGFAKEALGEGPVAWETPEGNNLQAARVASEATEQAIDEEVKRIVACAYETAMNTLTENRAFLDTLTEKLIEKETLDYKELEQMREEMAVNYPVDPIMPKIEAAVVTR